MVEELKEIAQLSEMKSDAIKQYTKEVKEELEKSLEVEKHDKMKAQQLKEVLTKNNDLITKTDKVIRLNENQVLWIDKTKVKVNTLNFDKMSPEEKIKYEKLKTEIELKTKQLKDIEASVTTTEDKMVKLRLVIMSHAKSVLSSIGIKSNDMAMILAEYNEMNGLMSKVIDGLRRFGMWLSQLFNRE